MSSTQVSPYLTSTPLISEYPASTRDIKGTEATQSGDQLRNIAEGYLVSQGTRSEETPQGVIGDLQRQIQEFQRSLNIVVAFLSSGPQFTQVLLDSKVELLYGFEEGRQSIAGITFQDDNSSSVLTLRTNGSIEFRSPERSFTTTIDKLSEEQLSRLQDSGLAARLSAKAALVEILISTVQDGRNSDLSQQNQLASELLNLSDYLVTSTPSYPEGQSIPIDGPDGSIAYIARRAGRAGQAPEITIQLDNLVIQGRRDGSIEFFRATGGTFTKAERLNPEEISVLRNFHSYQAPLIRLLQQGEAPSSI